MRCRRGCCCGGVVVIPPDVADADGDDDDDGRVEKIVGNMKPPRLSSSEILLNWAANMTDVLPDEMMASKVNPSEATPASMEASRVIDNSDGGFYSSSGGGRLRRFCSNGHDG